MSCDISFYSFSLLQLRMSQAHRMGFEEFSRDSQISRLFVQKYIFASTGEDEGESDVGAEENLDGVRSLKIIPTCFDFVQPLIQKQKINWAEELSKIQGNLTAEGIKWNETSQPFITVKGTAQVSKSN